ncbi:MAG: ABC transporter ATP-binding protein [Candidatus Jordarchaeaceae archaeon]
MKDEFVEEAYFSGKRMAQAVEWCKEREEKIIEVEVQGKWQKTGEDFRGKGYFLGAYATPLRAVIVMRLQQGKLGNGSINSDEIVTIGTPSSKEDVQAENIILRNFMEKNLSEDRFFDGINFSSATSWLRDKLKRYKVNVKIKGIWEKTQEPFTAEGEVVGVEDTITSGHFAIRVKSGSISDKPVEQNIILKIGGSSKLRKNFNDVVAQKILFMPEERPKSKATDNVVLRVQGLTVSYNKRPVISDVNFELKEGEILGIVGESGSGKSTCMKAIIGDIKIDKGEIEICGYDARDKDNVAPLFGYVPQDLSRMYMDFTPMENIVYFGKQYDIPEVELIRRGKQILKDLHIFEKGGEKVENLSGGEKRRVSIAIALVHLPKILFLDEPSSGLDLIRRHELWEYLDRINKLYGTSLVVITHYPSEIDYCDKAAIFVRNKGFVDFGTPEQLKERLPGKGYTIGLVLEEYDPKIVEIIRKVKGVEYVLQKGEQLKIFPSKDHNTVLKSILDKLEAKKITPKKVEPKIEIDMDDYFIYLTGNTEALT